MKAQALALFSLALILTGCDSAAPACPTPSGTAEYLSLPAPTASPNTSTPVQVEIGGQTIEVDQVVEGPLCNGNWSGTVYVTCNVQVLPWDEQPDFLRHCDLSIAPNTLVYVAYHNDAPFYSGCACHTGELDGP